MALERELEDMLKSDNIDANKILDSLLNPKNIDMKTHIVSPITFAVLEGICDNLDILISSISTKKMSLPRTTRLLKTLRIKIKMFLVSWNRLSREEITKTLQSTRQEGVGERSLYQKLLGLKEQ